jgi:hypothetical protein
LGWQEIFLGSAIGLIAGCAKRANAWHMDRERQLGFFVSLKVTITSGTSCTGLLALGRLLQLLR